MIVEAVDTLRTLGWALLVWIVLLAAVVAFALHTLLVAVVWPPHAAWRAVTGALAASRALRALRAAHETPDASRAHAAPQPRPVPTWAHTDKDAA